MENKNKSWIIMLVKKEPLISLVLLTNYNASEKKKDIYDSHCIQKSLT